MTALDVLDWRRRVAELYRVVRTAADDDPQNAHALWRRGRDELFSAHPASPLRGVDRERFEGLSYGAYDPAFRFVVPVDETPPVDPAASRFSYPTGTDGLVTFERVGVVDLPGTGTLVVWWLASYGGGVFLPLKDALAGTATFGGGRYVLDTVKGADLGGRGRHLVVDLNFAYNPSCAYDPDWACPLAPASNSVEAEVPVGELVP